MSVSALLKYIGNLVVPRIHSVVIDAIPEDISGKKYLAAGGILMLVYRL